MDDSAGNVLSNFVRTGRTRDFLQVKVPFEEIQAEICLEILPKD